MPKSIEQLQAEKAAYEKQIAQLQHQNARLDNRIRYLNKGERDKRTHRLCTRMGFIEHTAPELKDLTEAEFYDLFDHLLNLPEVKNIIDKAVHSHLTKPIYDEWYGIKFKGRKEKFKTEHDTELRKHYVASRKLKEHFKDGKLPITAWKNEAESLKSEYEQAHTELEAIRRDVQNLRQIAVMTKYVSIDNRQTERDKEQFRNHDHPTNSK